MMGAHIPHLHNIKEAFLSYASSLLKEVVLRISSCDVTTNHLLTR